MFVAFLILWVVFNGRLTWEIVVFGAAISATLTFFCYRFLDMSPRKELRFLRRLPGLLAYAFTLLKEIVKSNAALIRIVYHQKREIKPQLVSFDTPLKGRADRALLADSITLTPGTITALCEDGRMTVHCLDATFSEGIDDCVFQRLLLKAEKEDKQA